MLAWQTRQMINFLYPNKRFSGSWMSHKTSLSGYGYGGTIDQLRADEFDRLGDTVYLDHAGTTLYAKTQVMESNLLCI